MLQGNRIGPDTLANLFESLATYPNNIRELRVAGQQQDKMGFRFVKPEKPESAKKHVFRVESRIAEAVCKNEKIIKLGMQFEFKDVLNR